MNLTGRRIGRSAALIEQRWGAAVAADVAAHASALIATNGEHLRAAGAALGARGHDVADVLTWVRVMRHPWFWRRSGLSTAALEALCDGWVEGVLAGAANGADIVAGRFAPLAVLVHRARRHHERAAPAVPLVLVVVALPDDDLVRHPQLVAEHVRNAFGSGETLARGRRGPLLVLTPRLPSLAERTRALIDSLGADPVLGVVPPRVWVEPIGTTRAAIEAHVRCIAD